MKSFFTFILAALFWAIGATLWSQTAEPTVSSNRPVLDETQWKKVVGQFEESVATLSTWLENCQNETKGLQTEIENLEGKIAKLRDKTRDGSGVIDEFRLKGLLNDLKDKLEKNSNLEHQWDDKQKEFEQKAMSLVSLYNDRIDSDLQTADSSTQSSRLNSTFNELVSLIQKRKQTLELIKRYQKKTSGENQIPLASFKDLKPSDKEGLLLTLDLIRDRKKGMEEQLEKWTIEEDEVKNELKLQGKMKDFLEDIQRMNEDSSFPHGSLKRSDLGDVTGDKEHKKLQSRLDDLQQKIDQGQTALTQINQLMTKVQNQLDGLGERNKK